MVRTDGTVWYVLMVLYGTYRWYCMVRTDGTVWYVLMVLYGKGIVKERVTCRKEITLAIVETIAH